MPIVVSDLRQDPLHLRLAVIIDTILEIEIDQALIRNPTVRCHGFEAQRRILSG